MGAYLSEPLTTKNSSDEANNFLASGSSSMQGWRISQEVRGGEIIFWGFLQRLSVGELVGRECCFPAWSVAFRHLDSLEFFFSPHRSKKTDKGWRKNEKNACCTGKKSAVWCWIMVDLDS